MSDDDYIVDEPVVPDVVRPVAKPRSVPVASSPTPAKGRKTKRDAVRSPRDGRVRKGAPDEPAEFEAGGAEPPKNFDPERIADACEVYWLRHKSDSFVVKFGDENWSILNESKVKKVLKTKFKYLKSTTRDDEALSEMDRVLMHVVEHRAIDGMMAGLAGYPAGLYTFPNGEKIIITRSPHPVKPVKGDWSLVREIIEGRLNMKLDDEKNGIDQTEYWHLYVRGILRSLMYGKPGSWTQRMMLVLAGPTDCGKSRLQKMITWLLGGREAPAKAYLTGQDQFNSNMLISEHLKNEELENVSKKLDDRLKFSEAVKAVVANEGTTARLMRTDPTTIYPFWVLTLSLNSDPDKMRPFPPLTPDFCEKVLMFLCRQVPMPWLTNSDDEKAAFNAAVQAQLPGYVHWLLHEFEPRPELLLGNNGKPARYGVRDFQHPTLAMELFDDTPAAELLMLIDAAQLGRVNSELVKGLKIWELTEPENQYDLQKRNAGRAQRGLPPISGDIWEGSALDLERLLLGEYPGWTSSVAREAKKFFMHNKCDRQLARLKEDQPDRVQHKRTKVGRFWTIARGGAG